MYRLAFPFESALSFAVSYGKMNLLDWWFGGVRESAIRSAGAGALLEPEAG